MRAFVIRPFGEKSGIDFDAIERLLIDPALTALAITGRTTQDVIEAGNIREDMFQLLLIADVVVADISIDNANAFYELGIRHALREKRTFLIRAQGMPTRVPFDLTTDRYLAYDPARPADTVAALTDGLRATVSSDRQDSPVFRMLPELREQERSKFVPIPRTFREEVEVAFARGTWGKLALLAQEVKDTSWESEGLRLVGRRQFQAKQIEGARVTLEAILAIDGLDTEANLLLGTVYQRLGDLPLSDAALTRVVERRDAPPKDLAEAWSLLGRNQKARWRAQWAELPPEPRRVNALESPRLAEAYEAYAKAFRVDLNHFYAGLNALALLAVRLELAKTLPSVWAEGFADQAEADRERETLEKMRRQLAAAVDLGIAAEKQRLAAAGKSDPWVDVSGPDLQTLVADPTRSLLKPYRAALEGRPAFVADAARGQLQLYQDLGLFGPKIDPVLEWLGPAARPEATVAPRTILFTGHRIDAVDRPRPRFPAAHEADAREAIRAALRHELTTSPALVGIAGGANGGDILFHEVCAELGIPTSLRLALPAEDYVAASVAPAAGDWIRRFWAVKDRCQAVPVLVDTAAMPAWLQTRQNYDVWRRNGCWLLCEALTAGARNLTVLALWDGQPGDGPGGTADIVTTARARGAEVRVLDTATLFEPPRAATA